MTDLTTAPATHRPLLTLNRILNKDPGVPALLSELPPLLVAELVEEAKEHGDDTDVQISLLAPAKGPPRWVVFLPWMSADPVIIPLGDESPAKPSAPPKGGLLVHDVGSDRVMRAQHLDGPYFFVEAEESRSDPPRGDEEHMISAANDADTKMLIMDRAGNPPDPAVGT